LEDLAGRGIAERRCDMRESYKRVFGASIVDRHDSKDLKRGWRGRRANATVLAGG
jgi:hypothetical protein